MKFEKLVLEGRVVELNNSIYPDCDYKGDDYFLTMPVDELNFKIDGIVGDRHRGFTTISGGRLTSLYDRGIEVRNNRMWSAISPQEVYYIDKRLETNNKLTPGLLGINLVIDGLGYLSSLKPMTYLVFSPDQENFKPGRKNDVVLVVYAQALPCRIAGKAIAQALDAPNAEKNFAKVGLGYRGTTGWVEKPGIIKRDYKVFALTPTGQD